MNFEIIARVQLHKFLVSLIIYLWNVLTYIYIYTLLHL